MSSYNNYIFNGFFDLSIFGLSNFIPSLDWLSVEWLVWAMYGEDGLLFNLEVDGVVGSSFNLVVLIFVVLTGADEEFSFFIKKWIVNEIFFKEKQYWNNYF